MVSTTLLRTVASNRDSGSLTWTVRVASVLFITALTAAAAQISIPLPFSSVPFTFQPMVVLLGGVALGARLGAASQILYLALGIAGLPVFATSPLLAPGILRLLGPTGGYLMAYPFAAFLAGAIAERFAGRRYLVSLLAMAAGLAVVYASGALWLGYFARTMSGSPAIGFGAAFATGVAPFVLADAVKLLFAASIVPALWSLVGRRAE